MARPRARLVPWLAALFITAGAMHFVVPHRYERIVPSYVPDAPLMVQLSGVAEMAGGLGLLVASLRPLASWGLILMPSSAIFPANIELRQGAAEHASFVWQAALWLRLPFQPLVIWLVWRARTTAERS